MTMTYDKTMIAILALARIVNDNQLRSKLKRNLQTYIYDGGTFIVEATRLLRLITTMPGSCIVNKKEFCGVT
jgi:hypothetical protein